MFFIPVQELTTRSWQRLCTTQVQTKEQKERKRWDRFY